MKTRLVTVATEARHYFDDFVASARCYVGEPVLIGWGRSMPRIENEKKHLLKSHRIYKLHWTLEWLREHVDEQTHILFVDAWDCVLQRPLRDIEQVYRARGKKMLLASDSLAWPLHPKDFPHVCHKYLSLNSGVWMAESRYALEAIEKMLAEFKDGYEDDQGIIQQAYVSGRYDIATDYRNQMAYTVLPGPYLHSPFDFALDEKLHKVRCAHTNTVPCIVHCNGIGSTIHKSRMEHAAARIFEFLRPCSSRVEQALDKRQVASASLASGTNFKFRVFGIGLSRTGTTSLTNALNALKISSAHCPWTHDDVAAHQSATDTSIAIGMAYLDAMYPRSKFILTVRSDIEAWLNSCEWLWKTHLRHQHPFHQKIHKALYDTVDFDREKFRAAYERHTAEVMRVFKGREYDLLIMDIAAGDGWEKLCPFLGLPVPEQKFPHANQKI